MVELTDREITRMVELVEAAGIGDWGNAISPLLGEAVGKRVKGIGGAVATATLNVDIPLFNRVIGLGIAEPATEAMVDEIVELYRPGNVRFMAQVSPAAQPAEIPKWLEARGLKAHDRWGKFYRNVESLPEVATDLRIEEVGEEDRDTFMEVGFKGFGIPQSVEVIRPWMSATIGRESWKHYLAYDGDVPVAIGILFVKGEVGSLLGAATLPSYRGRGAQGALMARRMRAAAEMGCKWVITETGEETPDLPNPSYRNMVRLGFQLAYLRQNYVFTPA